VCAGPVAIYPTQQECTSAGPGPISATALKLGTLMSF